MSSRATMEHSVKYGCTPILQIMRKSTNRAALLLRSLALLIALVVPSLLAVTTPAQAAARIINCTGSRPDSTYLSVRYYHAGRSCTVSQFIMSFGNAFQEGSMQFHSHPDSRPLNENFTERFNVNPGAGVYNRTAHSGCTIGAGGPSPFSATAGQDCTTNRSIGGTESASVLNVLLDGTSLTMDVTYTLLGSSPPSNLTLNSSQITVEDSVAPVLNSFTRQTPVTSPTNAGTLIFRITFSEWVENVTADDFFVSGATTATATNVNRVNSSVYDVTVSGGDLALFNGIVGLDLKNGHDITDFVGNALPNTQPAADESYTVDSVKPTVIVTGVPSLTSLSSFTATFTFNEDINNFDLADVTAGLTNASATGFATTTPKRVFSAVITPNGAGNVSVGVNATSAQDDVGNDNIANGVSSTLDITAPTVEILGLPATHDGATPFDFTVEFSEDVTNFVAGDVSLVNATVSNFAAVDGNTYSVQITPINRKAVTIDINAGVAQDAIGNLNIAAPQAIVASTVIEYTRRIIGSFLENRAAGISNSQPNLGGFINGSRGSLNLNGDDNGLTLNYAASVTLNAAGQSIGASFDAVDNASRKGNIDLGAQVMGANTNAGNADSSLWVGYFGGHKFLSDDMLIGALVQVGWSDHTLQAKLQIRMSFTRHVLRGVDQTITSLHLVPTPTSLKPNVGLFLASSMGSINGVT